MDECWVYDIVRNMEHIIVAVCYHQESPEASYMHPNCLLHNEQELINEGLSLQCSQAFPTRQDACVEAWTKKDQFAKDLD